jgi:ribosome-associated protein
VSRPAALAGIPERELRFQYVRAAGPGGQNVNKVATAAQLRFDLAGTAALAPAVKVRLRGLAGRRVGAGGWLVISARNHRTREGNQREALQRLAQLIERARVEPGVRQATRPTAGSRQRRLDLKRHRQRLKRLRAPLDQE